MKNVIASLVAVAGLSVAASATTTVNMLVSTDGVNFSNNVNLTANTGLQLVEIMATVSTDNAAATGLGSFQFQPTVSNWRATDVVLPFTAAFGANTTTPSGVVSDAPGQYGRISPWGAANNFSSARLFGHVHLTSGGAGQPPSGTYLRIAQAQVTNWFGFGTGSNNITGGSGVNIKQLNSQQPGRGASEPAFNSSLTNIRVFRFGIQVDTSAAGRSQLVVDAPNEGFGNLNTTTNQREVYWYGNAFEVTGSVREVPVIGTATITIPTPASLALMGLGGLAVARRRRA